MDEQREHRRQPEQPPLALVVVRLRQSAVQWVGAVGGHLGPRLLRHALERTAGETLKDQTQQTKVLEANVLGAIASTSKNNQQERERKFREAGAEAANSTELSC